MKNKNELIDNIEFENHQVDYTFSHGYSFGVPARIASGIVSLFFSITFMSALLNLFLLGVFISLIFLIPLLFVVSSTTGVQLSIHSKYYKPYTSFLGLKYGKWKSTQIYSDVAILTIRNSRYVNSIGAGSVKIENVETGVYFLTPSHRKRILIEVCKNKTEADESAEKLAIEFDKKLNTFNPKISAKTLAKRR
jgi:hypothetical protein